MSASASSKNVLNAAIRPYIDSSRSVRRSILSDKNKIVAADVNMTHAMGMDAAAGATPRNAPKGAPPNTAKNGYNIKIMGASASILGIKCIPISVIDGKSSVANIGPPPVATAHVIIATITAKTANKNDSRDTFSVSGDLTVYDIKKCTAYYTYAIYRQTR